MSICNEYETPEFWRAYAAAWSDQFGEGEDGHANPDDVDWSLVDDFSLDRVAVDVADREGWIEFIRNEIRMFREDAMPERADYYEDLARGRVTNDEPIVVFENEKGGFVWDGNHRFAAACFRGDTTIPAVVGTRKCEPTLKVGI